LYRAGRRLQADSDRHDGPWLRGVSVPAVVVTALVMLVPVVVVSWLLSSLGVAGDMAPELAAGLFLFPGWVLYLVVLGVETSGET
jgi:hypothetical protein